MSTALDILDTDAPGDTTTTPTTTTTTTTSSSPPPTTTTTTTTTSPTPDTPDTPNTSTEAMIALMSSVDEEEQLQDDLDQQESLQENPKHSSPSPPPSQNVNKSPSPPPKADQKDRSNFRDLTVNTNPRPFRSPLIEQLDSTTSMDSTMSMESTLTEDPSTPMTPRTRKAKKRKKKAKAKKKKKRFANRSALLETQDSTLSQASKSSTRSKKKRKKKPKKKSTKRSAREQQKAMERLSSDRPVQQPLVWEYQASSENNSATSPGRSKALPQLSQYMEPFADVSVAPNLMGSYDALNDRYISNSYKRQIVENLKKKGMPGAVQPTTKVIPVEKNGTAFFQDEYLGRSPKSSPRSPKRSPKRKKKEQKRKSASPRRGRSTSPKKERQAEVVVLPDHPSMQKDNAAPRTPRTKKKQYQKMKARLEIVKIDKSADKKKGKKKKGFKSEMAHHSKSPKRSGKKGKKGPKGSLSHKNHGKKPKKSPGSSVIERLSKVNTSPAKDAEQDKQPSRKLTWEQQQQAVSRLYVIPKPKEPQEDPNGKPKTYKASRKEIESAVSRLSAPRHPKQSPEKQEETPPKPIKSKRPSQKSQQAAIDRLYPKSNANTATSKTPSPSKPSNPKPAKSSPKQRPAQSAPKSSEKPAQSSDASTDDSSSSSSTLGQDTKSSSSKSNKDNKSEENNVSFTPDLSASRRSKPKSTLTINVYEYKGKVRGDNEHPNAPAFTVSVDVKSKHATYDGTLKIAVRKLTLSYDGWEDYVLYDPVQDLVLSQVSEFENKMSVVIMKEKTLKKHREKFDFKNWFTWDEQNRVYRECSRCGVTFCRLFNTSAECLPHHKGGRLLQYGKTEPVWSCCFKPYTHANDDETGCTNLGHKGKVARPINIEPHPDEKNKKQIKELKKQLSMLAAMKQGNQKLMDDLDKKLAKGEHKETQQEPKQNATAVKTETKTSTAVTDGPNPDSDAVVAALSTSPTQKSTSVNTSVSTTTTTTTTTTVTKLKNGEVVDEQQKVEKKVEEEGEEEDEK